VTGPLLLVILRRTDRPSVGFAGLVALSVVAAAASWAAGAAVVGTEAEAARIPAFGIGLLVGSIALRLADERHRTVGW
jgi:murein endopeptidase